MNNLTKIFCILASGLAVQQTAGGTPDKAAPATSTAAKPALSKPAPIRSVFVLPANAQEGRDPFFPESPRPFEATASANSRSAVEISTLVCKGVLGSPGHFVAIINNHAFAVGDEGEVKTAGGRLRIRCVEIHKNLVAVEINGLRRDLNIEAR